VKSAKKAAKIYKRAVELGHVDAMLNLAKLYATGDGVKLDKKKMMQLYRNAGADRGHAYGQYMLGLCLIQQKQAEEGLSYMRLAADQGLILSCTALGMIYEAGQGDIERDTDEARRWFELAVAKGNALENARFSKENKLDSMKPTAREAISDARAALDRLGADDALA
jgi:TPR repeat protein